MADILSSEELDTLLTAVDDGEVGVSSGKANRREKRVSGYDFKKPNRFSRDQLRVLQYMHKNAAQLMSSNLSSALRIGVDVQLVSIGQLTYEAFITSLADPICLNVLTLKPLEFLGVLTLDLPLSFAIIERMLGGPGAIPESVRSLTLLEETIISQAISMILEDLHECWKDVAPLELKLERREMTPGFVSVVPGSEIVLLMTFSVGGQLASGEMKFCVPYVSLDPIMSKLGTEHMGIRANKASPEDRVHLEDHLGGTPLQLSARLGSTQLTIAELLSLEIGHVLQLDSKAATPIPCELEGETKFYVTPGRVGRKAGMCIQHVVPCGRTRPAETPPTEEAPEP